MKFGEVAVDEATGGIVAHAVRRDGLVLKKGDVVSSREIKALRAAGVQSIVVARLEPHDVGEDEAALQLARAVSGANVRVAKPFTGRSNLFSEAAGVLVVDTGRVDGINDVDERVTIATLPPYKTVEAGEMIGTVKIIPFAVPGETLAACVAKAHGAPLEVKAFRPLKVGVVSTLLPGLKSSIVTKTLRVLEERLAPAAATISREMRVAHETSALADAVRETLPSCDLLVIFGASAITDRRDVIPSAVERAGGRIEHFGMPVDPGNLLLVGVFSEGATKKHVLGAPGCARSPKENGFDWVLHRLLAGVEVTSGDIKRMGAGGLLMEIVQRGHPRGGEAQSAHE